MFIKLVLGTFIHLPSPTRRIRTPFEVADMAHLCPIQPFCGCNSWKSNYRSNKCHAFFTERVPCCQSSESLSALHGRLSECGKITTLKFGVLVSTVDTYFYFYYGWHFQMIMKNPKAVAQTCSVKKVFLEISQNSQETPVPGSLF